MRYSSARSVIGFCLALAAGCSTGFPANQAKAQLVAKCSAGGSPSPSNIAPGQSTSFQLAYNCFDKATNQLVADTVTIQITGLPKGASISSPNPPTASTNSATHITIQTSKTTPSGPVTLNVGGKGSKCGIYTPACVEQFTVAAKPQISSEGNKSAVWWFNGAEPSGFTKHLTLTATQKGNTKFTWSIDGKYAKIIDPKANPATLEVDCQVGTPCPPQDEGMVSVTVSGLGLTSDPFPVSVLTPYQAIPLPVPLDDPDNKGAGALFYFSHIPYQITDQFGKPLPKKPPVREHFTAPAVNQCKVVVAGIPIPCNWHASHEAGSGEAGRLGTTGCSTSGPGIVCDTISGQAKDQAPLVPSLPTPECPNNDCSTPSDGSSTLKVLCFPGELWVGNGASPPAPPKGVKVMTMIWQRYQDHARHCNILSPLDGSGSVADACTCP